MRVLLAFLAMCFAAESAFADQNYTFMQFNCDSVGNTLKINRVYAGDYPDFRSLDNIPGVLKEDLGIKLSSVEKLEQFPKTVARCLLSNAQNENHDVSLVLTEYHQAKHRGLCAAASGPVYEIHINNKVVARFRSDKDRCYPRLNPLNVSSMTYSWGRVGLCRIPENSSANLQSLSVHWEGELCLYGKPEQIINNQDVMKNFEHSLFDNIALDEARRELHLYRNSRVLPAQLEATEKRLNAKISRLEKELKVEKSKTFWQRIFSRID